MASQQSIDIFNSYVVGIQSIYDKYNGGEGGSIGDQIVSYMSFLQENPDIKVILEIGFNFGYSSVAFLSARSDITVISVDIGIHPYVNECKLVVDKMYPNRHQLIIGSSLDIIPLLKNNSKPDCILIDGDHRHPVPTIDLKNCLSLADEKTWTILDDISLTYGWNGVLQAMIDVMNSGEILVETCSSKYSGNRGWVFFKKNPNFIPKNPSYDNQRLPSL
jgi:hypothetical protein